MTRVPKELAESMVKKASVICSRGSTAITNEAFMRDVFVDRPVQPPKDVTNFVPAPARIKRAWSNAKPTTVRGIKFPSKLEAAWFEHLSTIATATGARLYRQVKFPLLDIGAEETGIPRYFCVDFVLRGGPGDRVIDAKGRESRDWSRGKAAFEAEYGIQVEIVKGMPK